MEIKYSQNNTHKTKFILKNNDNSELPFPPANRMYYNETARRHKVTGEKDFQFLFDLLKKNNFTFNDKRVLEFGCSNSRVLRHFEPFTDKNEFWGCDINSNMVSWSIENLSPPFNFFINTTQPHLPFKDGYLDLVYAYSIFTHIDDLFFSWVLELKRILKEKSYLYLTIHDEISVNFGFENPDRRIGKSISEYSEDFKSFLNGDYNILAIKRNNTSQAFIKRAYFKERMQAFGFEIVDSINYTMGGHQSAFLLKSN